MKHEDMIPLRRGGGTLGKYTSIGMFSVAAMLLIGQVGGQPEATKAPEAAVKQPPVKLAVQIRSAPDPEVTLEIEGGGVKVVQVDKVIIVKQDLTLVSSFPFTVKAPPGGFIYSWQYPSGVEAIRRANKLDVSKAPKGMLVVAVEYAVVDFVKQTTEIKFGQVSFSVGVVPDPTPIPPDPPDPKPPIPGGMRVVIVHEAADDSKIPYSQFLAMDSKKVIDYLNAKCVGGKSGWRKWDKDQKVENDTKIWQDLWAVVKPALAGKTLPMVFIFNNLEGDPHAVPLTVDGMMALLKKYGG